MTVPDHDLAVVGTGIVGLAVARELLRRHPGLSIVLIDKQADVGYHQTGHNSGVVHAGIYYEPGSLKARLCVEGARLLYAYCDEHGIAYERCGKLIVARSSAELPRLDALEERARRNGVPGLRRLDGDELRDVEPHCRGVAALHSPQSGIVDYRAVARSLAAELRTAGAEFVLGTQITSARRSGGTTTLCHAAGEIRTRHAVFCAGMWSDRLAAAAGASPDPRIVPFRGAYLRLVPEARGIVRGMIYPVPDPALPFLGVHITRHIDGEVLLGPTALMVGARDAYSLRTVRPTDLAQTLAWPGTWRMMRRFWRSGLGELHMAVSRRAFVRACQDYVPGLEPRHVARGSMAGVRAQAVSREGRLVDDFLVSETSTGVHVRNAPSPAATSSLALGKEIAGRVEAAFGLTAA
jgi:L-2-hydroxyglutarate oxidase